MIDMRWSIVAAALAVVFAWPAAAVEQAGVTAAVRGQVDLIPIVDKAKHRAKSGEDVFLGDEISSLDESGMQLMLLDETVFTIGPNTDMTIDDFVYDPATGAGQVTASLAKGVLRFVTGKVARGDPEDMVVKLPVGTIGIRGTIGVAVYDGVNPALVVLLGPGSRNNADARQGRLAVTAAGKTVALTRTGWGTSIAPGGPPSDPFQFSPDQIASIVNQFTPKPTAPEPADESEGGRATEAGGQDTAEARLTSVSTIGTGEISDDLGTRATEAATTSSAILDGVASNDQLLSIETGTFQYDIPIAPFVQTKRLGVTVDILGHFHASFQIDFGAKQISGTIDVDTFEDGNVDTIGGSLFGNLNFGSANTNTSIFVDYSLDSGELATGDFDSIDSEFANTNGELINSNGIIANLGKLNVIYDDGSNAGSGSATSGPRQLVGGI